MRRLVLWGHHLDESIDMFDLSSKDLQKRFLEYASGATAFNAELTVLGGQCLSYDPWFAFEPLHLSQMIEQQFDARIREFQAQQQALDVSRYGGSFDQLITYRREGIATFLADYERGRLDGRYVANLSPHQVPQTLPFEHSSFDIALVAHAFFSDVPYQTIDDHVLMIEELARVAKEVRIFPLVDAQGIPSPCLGPVLLGLQQDNFGIEVREVSYHLQPKGHAMLRVWAKQCEVF